MGRLNVQRSWNPKNNPSPAYFGIVHEMKFFQQVATDAMENIRTVASLSKEAHFVREYKKLTDIQVG